MTRQMYLRLLVFIAFGLVLWFIPPPEGLTSQAWRLFAIFITTILVVMTSTLPVFTASILAMVATIFTGLLTAEQAYSGFSKGFIILIIVAFMVARGVIRSGLGNRIAYIIIRRLGKSTLGLSYSMAITDCIIAPAFPSNTARSGVLYPIIKAICVGGGSDPEDGTERKMGNFLMMSGIAGLTISSALWLTAMAANPAGAGMAADMGIDINFGNWFINSLAPSLAALALTPFILYKVANPAIKRTPDAPQIAQDELERMGPMSKQEWITALTFIFMVLGWAFSESLSLDKTAIAFLGLAVLMLANIFTQQDLEESGDALAIWIWFAILYTLSTFLNEFGFMTYIGDKIAASLAGFGWPVVYVVLIVAYVLIHYFFVSQTAQMLALYGVFLTVGLAAGIPPMLIALMLLFATNFFAAITPQGSSANVIFAGSGYLRNSEMYKYGAVVTAANTVIYLAVGTPWILILN